MHRQGDFIGLKKRCRISIFARDRLIFALKHDVPNLLLLSPLFVPDFVTFNNK